MRPSLASRSLRSRRSRWRAACLSAWRRCTASAIRSVISSSSAVPIWLRSMPSDMRASSTWWTRSSSMSLESSSDALRRERKLDWCSMDRDGTTALVGDVSCVWRLVDRPSLRLVRDSRLPVRRLSLRLRSLGGSSPALPLPLAPPPPVMPASLRLSCWTSSSTRWSCSSRSSRRLSLGSTLSPGRYLSRSVFFSASLLPRSGFALRKMSSSVVTVALGWVERTEARHDGHVYGCSEVAVEAWKTNHSFRQAPQKVCRQSSSVSGWWSRSVHICPCRR